MKFAAHSAVSMIQNMKRAVTANDIKRIEYTRLMSIHPNPLSKTAPVNMGINKSTSRLGLFFVVGTGDDRCKVMWSIRSSAGNSSAPDNLGCVVQSDAGTSLTTAYSSIFCSASGHPGRIKTEIASTTLYPNLHIKPGEKKMILEIRYYVVHIDKLTPRELFGFKVLNPPYILGGDGKICFDTIVIFTPNPGLFDENTPPS
jgi:hypothetical protein